MLTGAAACTAYDVMTILRKGRHDVKDLAVTVEGTRAPTSPRVFTALHYVYTVAGRGLDPNQVERAVKLSKEKYCSATIMLGKTATITYEIVLVEGDRASPIVVKTASYLLRRRRREGQAAHHHLGRDLEPLALGVDEPKLDRDRIGVVQVALDADEAQVIAKVGKARGRSSGHGVLPDDAFRRRIADRLHVHDLDFLRDGRRGARPGRR